jgi:hypothetical protein
MSDRILRGFVFIGKSFFLIGATGVTGERRDQDRADDGE